MDRERPHIFGPYMDKDTIKTKEWLDKRFAEGVKEGEYFAHQPIYGYKKGCTEGRDLIRYLRNLSILVKLSCLEFNSFIDVGGAEGYMANLVKTAFKVDTYTCDLSFEANLRARELFGIDSLAMDISNLPFKDEAFDVVLCSETLEHVTNPIQAICELKRITKKALIITTEAICYDRLERKLRMILVDLNEPHCDRNWFLADDFIFILGKDINYESTIYDPEIADKSASLEEAKKILENRTDRGVFTRDGVGITISSLKIQKNESPKINIKDLVSIILSTTANIEYKENLHEKKLYLNSKLMSLLRCPKCLGIVKLDKEILECSSCSNKYSIKKNIPLMYTSDKDIDYLPKKWNKRYLSEFNGEYKNLLKLKKLFEHTTARPNFLVRIFAWRILKIEKFIYNILKVMRRESGFGLVRHFLFMIKKKILREINRIINRIRKPILSDFKIGDIIEFVKDYRASDNEKILVRQGALGKVVDISNDNVVIKIEGIDYPIHLWDCPQCVGKPTIRYIKSVK